MPNMINMSKSGGQLFLWLLFSEKASILCAIKFTTVPTTQDFTNILEANPVIAFHQ